MSVRRVRLIAGFLAPAALCLWAGAGIAALQATAQTPTPAFARTTARPPVGAHYVRVSARKPAYFELDGTPFIPIGFNDAVSWANLMWLYDDLSPGAAEDFFKSLHAHHINTLRLMLSYNQEGDRYSFESPLGQPRPVMVALWDRIFQLAARYDVYLLLTPWDPFWMARNWGASAWNQANGGPCADMGCFFTDPKAIAAEEALYRFLIDRYGGSTQLLAWELINEADLWFKGSRTNRETAAALKAWIGQMSDFIGQTEFARWGARHLVTISTAAAQPGDAYAFLDDDPHLDFLTTHLYTDAMADPVDTVLPAQAASLAVITAVVGLDGRKPYLDSEDGPIKRWPLPEDFDVRYFHNMSWAELLSGAAGGGLRWPYTASGVLSEPYYQTLQALAAFAQAFPWLDDTYLPTSNDDPALAGDGADSVTAYGLIGAHSAALWLLNGREMATGPLDLKLTGLAAGSYRVTFWDTWGGRALSVADVDSAGTLTLTTPPVQRDLAVSIVPSPQPAK